MRLPEALQLWGRKAWAIALVAVVGLIVGANALMQRRARDRWTVSITDPSGRLR